jgi:FlaA1/EpsC-like NDP-sugar epimerase
LKESNYFVKKDQINNEFRKKRILITGGTGSIGLGITRQLLKYKPKEIRVLTNDENSIFESRRIIDFHKSVKIMMGDIRDKNRIYSAIQGVDIVFHAAAMKHVDICEQNPFDAVKTNVIGTSNILEASLKEKVQKFILISTDKATNPGSTLGASKLLAERLTLSTNPIKSIHKTKFSVVRFGNVVGSRGSVFQIFLQQLRKNHPLIVTDLKMTRFIMSISEASSLILKATCVMKGNEIFILKMPSVKIIDFAKTMEETYRERYHSEKTEIEIGKHKEGERFNEYLINNDELEHCEDVREMYVITKKKVNKLILLRDINSETANKVNSDQLKNTINEILDEYN